MQCATATKTMSTNCGPTCLGGPALVTPDPISKLSEWAMIFLASLMEMFAYSRMRRQKSSDLVQ